MAKETPLQMNTLLSVIRHVASDRGDRECCPGREASRMGQVSTHPLGQVRLGLPVPELFGL